MSRSTKLFIHGGITQKQLMLMPPRRDSQKRGILHPHCLPRCQCSSSSPVGSCHPLLVNSPCWNHPSSSLLLPKMPAVVGLCCVSRFPFTLAVSSPLCPLLITGLAVHGLLSPSGLPPRAQPASRIQLANTATCTRCVPQR